MFLFRAQVSHLPKKSLLFFSVSPAVESLHTLNDQISDFIVNKAKALTEEDDTFLPDEKETLKTSMLLMKHLLMDAQKFRAEGSINVL
uniref:Uncharacterized protein n=1 Tax=Sphaerodactylus townsendi TaxID=933632 RepID=A0ACB8EE66_9SAUR